jgi:hypothetical protein
MDEEYSSKFPIDRSTSENLLPNTAVTTSYANHFIARNVASLKDLESLSLPDEGLCRDVLSSDERRQLDMATIIYHLLLDQPSGLLPALSVASLEKFCTILLNPKFATHGQVLNLIFLPSPLVLKQV